MQINQTVSFFLSLSHSRSFEETEKRMKICRVKEGDNQHTHKRTHVGFGKNVRAKINAQPN